MPGARADILLGAMSVPLESWQVGPHNRWAYVHVDEVVPTVAVPRGDGPVHPLPPAPAPAGPALAELDVVREVLDGVETDGLVVLHDGALVLEAYRGEATATSLHLSQSVGKSVLGLLVGVLEGRGALRLDQPVTELVPEVAESGYAGATLGHLLDMTAAIGFVEDYAVDFWRYDIACAWHPPRPGADAETILDFLPTIGAADGWSHGERFHYATPNTDLLGVAAERAGGTPLAQLIARELWAPLGAEHDALLAVDHAGTASIGGGFCASARDYARLGQLVLDQGRGVVPAAYTLQLGNGHPPAFAATTVPGATSGADGYARQWWRRDGRTMARGIHGQMICVDRQTRTVVAVLSSWPDATDGPREAAHRRLVADVCAALEAG